MTDPTTKPWEQLTVEEARERMNAEREAMIAKHQADREKLKAYATANTRKLAGKDVI